MFSNTHNPFGHSSLKAIIVTWTLTAFIPVPLIICIFLIRYFPKTFNGLTWSTIFPHVRRGHKPSPCSFSGKHEAFTPSSRTLAVSGNSNYTLPGLNLLSTTPPQGHVSTSRTHLSPGTPQKLSSDSSQRTGPPTSKTSPKSNGSPKKSVICSDSSNLFFPASESPKCLSFLEPPSLTSTPRKAYSRLSPNGTPKRSVPLSYKSLQTPDVVRYRRLRTQFLVSAFLLSLVVPLYILEGFAISSAQDYAHARVLTHANGKGGLGKGEEDERWLAPWIIYVVIQGGLMVFALWMVNSTRKIAKILALECAEHKRDDNKRPREDGMGDIELQDFGIDEENETFLPSDHTGNEDIFGDEFNDRAHPMDEEEEKEWKALGFYRTSAGPEKRPFPGHSYDPLQQDTCYISPNDNGEGSSSGPSYSNGSGFNGYMDDSGVPLPDLKNSWKQANDKEQDSVLQSKSWKGKGKEMENDEPEPSTITAPRGNDNHPQQPPARKSELPSGIDLKTDYQFIDGLAYPIIALPKRNRKPSLSTSSQPPSTPFNNENDIAYPFPLAYPITPSPTPSFTSSISSHRCLPAPPPPGPKPNFLSRFPFDPTNKTNLNNSNSTPPRTPTRALNIFNPQTPPPPPPPAARANAARNYTFSPPGSPYAASATFTPWSTSYTPHPHNQNQTHLLASPSFSSSPTTISATGYPTPTPTPPSTAATAAGAKVRIPTGSTVTLPSRVLNTLSRNALSPSTALGEGELLSTPPSLTGSSSPLTNSSSSPLSTSTSIDSSSPISYTSSSPSPSTTTSLRPIALQLSPRSARGVAARGKIARKASVRGKKGSYSYRKLGSGLGTVSEVEGAGVEVEGGWF